MIGTVVGSILITVKKDIQNFFMNLTMYIDFSIINKLEILVFGHYNLSEVILTYEFALGMNASVGKSIMKKK